MGELSPSRVEAPVRDVFDAYERKHPGATVDAFRLGDRALKLRVLDPRFESLSEPERFDAVLDRWLAVDAPRAREDVIGLLALTPVEAAGDVLNEEFERTLDAARSRPRDAVSAA